MKKNLKELVENKFIDKFNTKPIVVCSPGRINLIGEHTDYNMGFVLPAAIDKAMYLAIAPSNNEIINLFAADLNDNYATTLNNYTTSNKEWPNYILGVLNQLQIMGKKLGGFNTIFSSDIPLGAGLSSSAALSCAIVFALNNIFYLGLTQLQMAQIAQQAEREFVGVNCGIMDQFASMFGKKNHVIKLDCRSLMYEYVPFNFSGIKVVLFDSMVKHSLASSAYNERNQQCQHGVAIIQQKYPEVNSLRDATSQIVDECLAHEDVLIYNRCKFVVQEMARLHAACQHLITQNIAEFGSLMYQTHHGLSQLYEVSCPELDFIAHCAQQETEILGARMMGGGFGGCVIALVNQHTAKQVIEYIANAYFVKLGKTMKVYEVSIEDGTRLL